MEIPGKQGQIWSNRVRTGPAAGIVNPTTSLKRAEGDADRARRLIQLLHLYTLRPRAHTRPWEGI